MRRSFVAALGTALFLLASAVWAGAPNVPVLNWFPCPGVAPGPECAIAQVPLDYDEPMGAQTYVVLARYPAADPANRIGSVFVNFGGPGISGVNRLLSGFGQTMAFLLQGRFDVVSFDPRGVGYSDPLQCFETEEQRAAYLAGLPSFPYLDEQERHYFEVASGLAPICLERGQPIVSHMSTADVARDMDLLRQAVGDERMTYLGFSYGSYLGNTYANMFPDKVRALVIDGVIDPLIWTIGRQISSDRIAVQAVADEFNRLCDEAAAISPALCPMSGPEGAAATFDSLAEALKGTPILLPDGSLYTYDRLIGDTVGCMYSPEAWPYCAAVVAFLSNAVRGDMDAGRQAAAAREAMMKQLRGDDAVRAYNNGFDASYGVQCADTQHRKPFAAYAALDGWTYKGSIFGPYWWWQSTPCANWPLAEDRYAGPWTARTSAPVLVVGNYFDPATDYAGAVASDKFLKNSRLLSYAGWGHCAFPRANACVVSHVVQYLLDGSLPPKGTVCPANPNPFLPAMSTTSGAGSVSKSRTLTIGLPPIWLER